MFPESVPTFWDSGSLDDTAFELVVERAPRWLEMRSIVDLSYYEKLFDFGG